MNQPFGGTLDHTSIRISNLERSRAFYEKLLGLTTAPRPDLGLPGVWYDLGQGQLHLIQTGPKFDGIDPTGPHFAIQEIGRASCRERVYVLV